MSDLDKEIFGEEEPFQRAAEVNQDQVTEAAASTQTTETPGEAGDGVSPAPGQPNHSQQEPGTQQHGLEAAVVAERRRRQEAEDKVRQMEAQWQQQNQQQPGSESPPDFWENPEGVLQGMEQRFQKMLHERDVRQQNLRIADSAYRARQRHNDFDAKLETFRDMAAKNPMLEQQMQGQHDPAEFVYQMAQQAQEVNELGGLDTYRQATEAKLRAELEKEYQDKLREQLAASDRLPGSMGKLRASGGGTQGSNTPLKDEDLFDN